MLAEMPTMQHYSYVCVYLCIALVAIKGQGVLCQLLQELEALCLPQLCKPAAQTSLCH